MKPAKPSDMATLLGSCPVHKAVVKAVGYGAVPCQDVVHTLQDTIAVHGQAALDGVARALLDYERHGTVLYAKLKPALHVYCRMLLGPMPSEWADWWQNPDGTNRSGKPAAWPPTLPGPGADRSVAVPNVTADAPESVSATPVSDVEALKAMHGRQLRLLLKAEHDRYLRFPPSDPVHQETVSRMDLIESEMRRRGNKVPPRPAWPEPYDPDADRFRRATSARLRELLGMSQYELTRNPPGSVTYQEAVRDIGRIRAESRSRDVESPGPERKEVA